MSQQVEKFDAFIMYHKDSPDGTLFKSQEQWERAGSGWVDHPHKIGKAEPVLKAPEAQPYKEHQEQWESKEEKAPAPVGAKEEAKAKKVAAAAAKKASKAKQKEAQLNA